MQDKGIDWLPAGYGLDQTDDVWQRFDARLAQIDRIPDLPTAFDPIEWDESGLPR